MRDKVVILESIFLDQTAEGEFLIYLMKTASFAKAREAVQKSIHSTDEYQQNFKRKCWKDGKSLELLIDLENFPSS